MTGRILILTGAPENRSLDWSSPALLSEFLEPIGRFAGLDRPTKASSGVSGVNDDGFEHAVWRFIPLEKPQHPSGFSQPVLGSDRDFPGFASSPEFFTTVAGETSFPSSQGIDEDPEAGRNILSQFYEHSLAVLGDVSSQLVSRSGESQVHLTSFMTDGTTSFRDEPTSFVTDAGDPDHLARAPLGNDAAAYHLSDLEDIPPGSYLTRIQPQTMTVNLIVGVISIAEPRTVQTRWGTSTLVEVVVGDETKSGFAITFWLSSQGAAENPLAGLRTQDVLLMQNVALNTYMKKVYGSNLRKDLTKVHLLYRRKLDSDDTGGYYSPTDMASAAQHHPQLAKTKRVWDWVLNFVGGNLRQNGGAGRAWDTPPLDTQ